MDSMGQEFGQVQQDSLSLPTMYGVLAGGLEGLGSGNI